MALLTCLQWLQIWTTLHNSQSVSVQHKELSLWQMDASVVVSYSTAKPVATSYLKTITLCTILRFSQWCCWRFNSFAKWHCITWHKVPDILDGHGTSVFWGLSSSVVVPDPLWRWRHYDPFKCWDLLVLMYGITSQKTAIFDHQSAS